MSLAEAARHGKGQQSFRTTDDLFNSLSVGSIRNILNKTRQQAHDKRDQLKELIGSRYRDFLAAGKTAESMREGVADISAQWDLIQTAHKEIVSLATPRGAEQTESSGDVSPKKKPAQACDPALLHATMRIVRAGQHLWSLIDESRFDQASLLYLQCERDLEYVAKNSPRLTAICARHWSSIQHIPHHICGAAARALRCTSKSKEPQRGATQNVDVDGESHIIAAALAALIVLQQLDVGSALQQLLKTRSRQLRAVRNGSSGLVDVNAGVASVLAQQVRIISDTAELAVLLFQLAPDSNGAVEQGLLAQSLDGVLGAAASDATSLANKIVVASQLRKIPPSTPLANVHTQDSVQRKLLEVVAEWSTREIETVRAQCAAAMCEKTSIESLSGVLRSVWAALDHGPVSTQQRTASTRSVCRMTLYNPALPQFDELLDNLIEHTRKEIIEQIAEYVESACTLARAASAATSASPDVNLDIDSLNDTGRLCKPMVLSVLGRVHHVCKLCDLFLSSQSILFGDAEVSPHSQNSPTTSLWTRVDDLLLSQETTNDESTNSLDSVQQSTQTKIKHFVHFVAGCVSAFVVGRADVQPHTLAEAGIPSQHSRLLNTLQLGECRQLVSPSGDRDDSEAAVAASVQLSFWTAVAEAASQFARSDFSYRSASGTEQDDGRPSNDHSPPIAVDDQLVSTLIVDFVVAEVKVSVVPHLRAVACYSLDNWSRLVETQSTTVFARRLARVFDDRRVQSASMWSVAPTSVQGVQYLRLLQPSIEISDILVRVAGACVRAQENVEGPDGPGPDEPFHLSVIQSVCKKMLIAMCEHVAFHSSQPPTLKTWSTEAASQLYVDVSFLLALPSQLAPSNNNTADAARVEPQALQSHLSSLIASRWQPDDTAKLKSELSETVADISVRFHESVYLLLGGSVVHSAGTTQTTAAAAATDDSDPHNLPIGTAMAPMAPRLQLLPGARKPPPLQPPTTWRKDDALAALFGTPAGQGASVTKRGVSKKVKKIVGEAPEGNDTGKQLLDDLRYDSLLQNSSYNYQPSDVASDTDDDVDDTDREANSRAPGEQWAAATSTGRVRSNVFNIGRSFFSNVGDRLKSFGGSGRGKKG